MVKYVMKVDLVGRSYDVGDNVKLGLPMTFTVTLMSWRIMEHGKQMATSGELGHAMDAIKWDANTDHYCWQRPEDMTTSRNAYRIDQNNLGSDFARETAATMATAPSCSAATILLTPESSLLMLSRSDCDSLLFDFADKYRGKYESNQYYLDYQGGNGDALGGTGWSMTEFGWDDNC
ncbi:putative cellulase [Helianthus anomalus]